ncbi:MAG: cell division protein [Caulobacteraceae bacterium]|nr:cell division protein [Caulobacteraceae bacterium]
MNPFGFLTRRVRGFRVIDIAAVTLIVTIAVGSYAFKTFASVEDADASGVESQILQEQKRIALLKAEIARLEDPRRVEALSTQYLGMVAVDPSHDIPANALPRIAANPPPVKPPKPGAPV